MVWAWIDDGPILERLQALETQLEEQKRRIAELEAHVAALSGSSATRSSNSQAERQTLRLRAEPMEEFFRTRPEPQAQLTPRLRAELSWREAREQREQQRSMRQSSRSRSRQPGRR